jgi:hypothetical protein
VLSLARAAVTAGACCPYCGKRPASANGSLAGLTAGIAALPPGRTGRRRTSGRAAIQRRTWISGAAGYALAIVPSNLPETGIGPSS